MSDLFVFDLNISLIYILRAEKKRNECIYLAMALESTISHLCRMEYVNRCRMQGADVTIGIIIIIII